MLNTYKKVQVVSLLLGIALIISAMLLIESPMISYLFFLVWIVFMQISFSRLHRKGLADFEKISMIWREELDPQKFIRALAEFIKKENLHPRHQFNFEYIVASVYHDLGKTDQSIKMLEGMLERISFFNLHKRRMIGYIYNSLATRYCYEKDVKNASEYYQLAKLFSLKSRKRERLSCLLRFTSAQIELLKGNHEESLKMAQAYLADAIYKIDQVKIHSLLAEIYESLGNVAQQKTHLQHVIEEGNKLYVVEIACEKLAEIR